MKSKSATFEPEFTHSLSIDKIPTPGTDVTLNANESERSALAKRFDLIELSKLRAHLNISSARAGEAFVVKGELVADVIQACVVTLEPLSVHLERQIDVLFASVEIPSVEEQASQMEMDTDDIEPIIGGQIDLGELVAQHLGISLDPYPRKEGVDFPGAEFGDTRAAANPFANLVELKPKPKK